MKKCHLAAAVIALSAGSAIAQSSDDLVVTFNLLEQMAAVCVTNPCPVTEFERNFMGIDFEGMRLELPDGTNREILRNVTAARIFICHRRNYVEPDAFSCVEL